MFTVANDAHYLHDTHENSFIFVGFKVDDKFNGFAGRRSNSVENNIEGDKPFKRTV